MAIKGSFEVVGVILRDWFWICTCCLVAGAAALGVSLVITPKYSSTVTMYVTTAGVDDTTQSIYQGSLASQERAKAYSSLVRTDVVLSSAVQHAGMDIPTDSARSMISASTPDDGVLLSITATSTDANISAKLANSVADSIRSYISVLETPPGGGRPLAKMTVVSPALASTAASSPKVLRNVVLGLTAGLIVGVLFVFFRVKYASRVRTVDDLSAAFDTPILSVVPHASDLQSAGVLDYSGGGIPFAEAYRKLGTALMYVNVDSPPRVIMVTSAIESEGKTLSSINLAAALVEAGNRVVIVDGDLRRPQLAARCGLSSSIGLADVLSDSLPVAGGIQETSLNGLYILACGTTPPSPVPLLSSSRLRDVFGELRQAFDYVIVDTPPVLPCGDALLLARNCDTCLLVVRSGSTREREVAHMLSQLVSVQAAIGGFVLTDLQATNSSYSYYYERSVADRSPS